MAAPRVEPFSAERVVGRLRALLRCPTALHEPQFPGNEWKYVKECLDTGWVSSAGAYVGRFERQLADVLGVDYVVATVNGTAALHIALQLTGVGAGDEVLLPALTFVATANAISYTGAHPHFLDSDERTLGVDAAKLQDYLRTIARMSGGACTNARTGRRIAALVCVHVLGHPADLDAVAEICRRYGIALVEDAAESLGSTYKGRPTGGFGAVAALSFNGNKIVTTGGGGALATRDAEIARRARHLTTTAKQPHAWAFNHDEVGYNYRLPNLNAALGCAQLESLPRFVQEKRRVAAAYQRAFADVSGVEVFAEAPYAQSNYWLNALMLDEGNAAARDPILAEVTAAGLGLRPFWTPMHELPMYAGCQRAPLDTTESLVRRTLSLPSSAALAATVA